MLVLSASAAGGIALGVLPAVAKSRRGPMASLDTDNDGTLDLAEAKKAASAVFDKLDTDHDGTLTKSEVGGRLSAKDFKSGDPDKDGTLTKDEYLAVVESRFRLADPDNDGTLTDAELGSKAGRRLLQLLR
jgi:Ca2+-binding EF-hand superfamily protein